MKSENQIDLKQYVSLHIDAFKRCGLWFYIPYRTWSIRFWVDVLTKTALGFFVFFLSTSGQILYFVKFAMCGDAEIQGMAAAANLTLAELLTSFKLLDLRMRRQRLMRVLRLLDTWPRHHRSAHIEVHGRAIVLARKLFLWLLFLTYIDVIVHAVIVPALNHYRTLPLKMDFLFFDVNQQPYFNYVCVYQILYKSIMVTSFVIIQSLPWALMLHAISELNILITTIENMETQVGIEVNENNFNENEGFKIMLRKCVDHYNLIARYVEAFQSAFSGQFAISMLMTVSVLGTTGVHILSIESVLHQISDVVWISIFMLLFTGMTLCDCYFGNIIAIKSVEVATALYSSSWMSWSPGFQRDVMMLMARSQRPLMVTVANLVPISLETFTGVMKWTYNGFAVLNHMKK